MKPLYKTMRPRHKAMKPYIWNIKQFMVQNQYIPNFFILIVQSVWWNLSH